MRLSPHSWLRNGRHVSAPEFTGALRRPLCGEGPPTVQVSASPAMHRRPVSYVTPQQPRLTQSLSGCGTLLDQARWAVETYAWRFDGLDRPPQPGGTT